MKKNGEDWDIRINVHGHTYFHQHSLTYRTNGTLMEEAQGETFQWHELKENFIKDFNFEPQNENLVESAKQIKEFVQPKIK